MSLGGRLDRMLDRIPGYAGYRDKERRRDSDRVVREQLALEYGQLAERLGRLATTLANERQIMAIGMVDKPQKRLVSFIDRLRTASYGYAPLFSENDVDGAALDQIAAFDRALDDQREQLEAQIEALEAADPKHSAFKERSNQVTETIEGLHDRFDHRGEVIASGKAATQQNVLDLLEPTRQSGPPVAYRLHEGEAVSYGGTDYSVVARVSADTSDGQWRAFQLRGGAGDQWLHASSDTTRPLYWVRRVDTPVDVTQSSVTFGGQTYTLETTADGTGEVIGQQGTAAGQRVRLVRYRSQAGGIVVVYDWGASAMVLAGSEIDPRDLQFFSREH